ncbi:hypothetical protein [Nostoc sp. CCY0012]|uniref:hypothetical protein n=1 Tax=Nostoc sp. CCY0012 TaxID=1056123 RepID=UPI0039C70C43
MKQYLLNTINETTYKTIDILTQIKNKSINSVGETVEQAKQSLNQTLGDTANNVNQITNKAVGAISETAKQAENSFIDKSHQLVTSVEDNFQKVEQFSTTIPTEIEQVINSLINNQLVHIKSWIDVHPMISWILKFSVWSINHPLFGFITILLILFSIWQLFKVFNRLIEKGLLATLTVPFKLVASLLKLSIKPLTFLSSNSQDTLKLETKQDRLNKLVSRLEILKQEQNDILQEISTIVSANKLS